MNHFYRKITILGLLVLFSILFIFSNSLKNKEESKEDSDVIVEFVENVAEKIFPENTVDWNYTVRKGAHLFEFCVLGMFTVVFFSQVERKRKYSIIYSFVCVSFIASADEFIQRFTGRGVSLKDVMIDIAGASIGIGLILLMNLLRKRMRNGAK